MIKKKIIACQIFTDELRAVLPEDYSDMDITWLDAGLHMNLDELETTLKQALEDAATEDTRASVLFGSGCHPDMCHIVGHHDGKVLGAQNCVHAFCGESIDALEQNRTMVMTPGWIRYFPKLMAAAGWDEVDVRQNLGRYDRILLMDTGINPLSEEEILEFYDLTQVPLEIQPIDLDHFRAKLLEMLNQ
jgi:uncharacterized protein DUF1638